MSTPDAIMFIVYVNQVGETEARIMVHDYHLDLLDSEMDDLLCHMYTPKLTLETPKLV